MTRGLVVLAYQDVGYVCLQALLQAGARVEAVLTHEDDPGEKIWFRSVADLASSHKIPVYKPENPNTPEVLSLVASFEPDFIFSFYYRHMLSAEFLNLARRGAYNLHGSLLPAYRGRAPINWVLVNGETRTGVTLHLMTPKPDDGPIAARNAVPIEESDTVMDLYGKMTRAASDLMTGIWPRLLAGQIELVPQDKSQASYFGGRKPKDGLIDWSLSAKRIYDLIRAVTEPYPGAFSRYQGKKLFIWTAKYDLQVDGGQKAGTVFEYAAPDNINKYPAVACGRGGLVIQKAQWENEEQKTGEHLIELGLVPGMTFDGHKGETI